jgi:hypothetical protein
VVNADSLHTWFLSALTDVDLSLSFDLHQDDQLHGHTLAQTRGTTSSQQCDIPGTGWTGVCTWSAETKPHATQCSAPGAILSPWV